MKTINDLYKDLSPDLKMSWDRDISNNTGSRAIRNSLIGIITTKRGTRPFDPDFGCDITDQLFDNMTPLIANTVEKSVTTAIRKYEPRIVRLNVVADAQHDQNTLVVTITFSILDNPDTLQELKLRMSSSR